MIDFSFGLTFCLYFISLLRFSAANTFSFDCRRRCNKCIERDKVRERARVARMERQLLLTANRTWALGSYRKRSWRTSNTRYLAYILHNLHCARWMIAFVGFSSSILANHRIPKKTVSGNLTNYMSKGIVDSFAFQRIVFFSLFFRYSSPSFCVALVKRKCFKLAHT